MSRLKTIQSRVEFCLETYPLCRDDDRILIGTMYSLFYDFDVKHRTAKDMLLCKDLPSFETIRRARQKAQEERPELRGSRTAREKRKAMEQEVRQYVKEA